MKRLTYFLTAGALLVCLALASAGERDVVVVRYDKFKDITTVETPSNRHKFLDPLHAQGVLVLLRQGQLVG